MSSIKLCRDNKKKNKDILDLKLFKDTNFCYYCKFKDLEILHKTFDYEKNKVYDSCYFCKVIKNFKEDYSFYLFLIKTDKTQEEINYFVNNYYNKNKKIPDYLEIDKDAKIVKMPIYLYIDENKDNDIKIYYMSNILNKSYENIKNLSNRKYIKYELEDKKDKKIKEALEIMFNIINSN